MSLFVRNRAAIVGAVEQTQWVDPWARLFLSGGRRVDDAWDARGHEFADKVKPEGWKGFSESLALARNDLEASWRARPDRPEAAVSMIEVTMAGGAAPGETPRLWFDRAVAARLDWMGAYNNMITSLRSRWGGQEGELLAFARECAATRRFDTEVPFQAMNAVEWLESDTWFEAKGEAEWPLFPYQRAPSPYATDEVYTLVEAVLERYRREPARQFEWRRFASLQAAIAYKAGKYERARELLHELGGTLENVGRDAVHEDTAEGRIEAYAAPDGAAVRRAERLFLEGHGARRGRSSRRLVRRRPSRRGRSSTSGSRRSRWKPSSRPGAAPACCPTRSCTGGAWRTGSGWSSRTAHCSAPPGAADS